MTARPDKHEDLRELAYLLLIPILCVALLVLA